MTRPRARATYRLQLGPRFGFEQAAAAVPYLAELGVSHLYLSPVLQAAAGSTHGYDVVDPDRVGEALGGEAWFTALARTAREAGLAILLDIVPNHMSIATAGGTANRWWLDVLENGPASYYAHFFDVDWASAGDDRILLPVLAERYGRALTLGQVAIAPAGNTLVVRAGELQLPLAPHALGAIVRRAGERIDHAELQFVGDAFAGLPTARDHASRVRRHRDKAVLLRRLGELCGDPACLHALDDLLAAIDADPVELDAILEQQHYRLAHWSVAGSQLPYRRFFDIATLVGLRAEDPEVFAASHARILGWLADGTIAGVRVDHVDGLREPGRYLARLREAAPGAWIVVEKILAPGEALAPGWPVDGTTGYDFMETLDALFVDPEAEAALTRAFTAYTGEPFDPARASRAARLEVMRDALHSELARLTELGARACGASPMCRDFTRAEIEAALAEILAGYPTYRTYLGEPDDDRGGDGRGAEVDRARIAAAVKAAAAVRPDLDRDLLAFLGAALAFELPSAESIELAAQAQQVSGAIVAKGDEDTLLYREVRLLSRCEVGSDPARFGITPDEAHRRLADGRAGSLLATSTHDTKRGEDVRARIAALSENPAAWQDAVTRWRARAEAGWGEVAPDRVFEYAAWQTLVGAWPLSLARARTWAEKATREARTRTSWRRPDAAYERACARWLEGIYADGELLAELERFAAQRRPLGDRIALAQLLVKLTAPGVPDFYQGAERRDDGLVDPDNRRPVDLAGHHARLRELRELNAADVRGELGAAKQWMIRRVLGLRARDARAFDGGYRALAACGPDAAAVFAFARTAAVDARIETAITVVPLCRRHDAGWRGTTLALPPGAWSEVLADRRVAGGAPVAVADLWATLPVALLVRRER